MNIILAYLGIISFKATTFKHPPLYHSLHWFPWPGMSSSSASSVQQTMISCRRSSFARFVFEGAQWFAKVYTVHYAVFCRVLSPGVHWAFFFWFCWALPTMVQIWSEQVNNYLLTFPLATRCRKGCAKMPANPTNKLAHTQTVSHPSYIIAIKHKADWNCNLTIYCNL